MYVYGSCPQQGHYEDDDDDLFPTNPRLKSCRKKATPFSQANQTKEGENVSTLNTVILMGVHLVRQMLDAGDDPIPLLKHIEFITKKSTLATYKHNLRDVR